MTLDPTSTTQGCGFFSHTPGSIFTVEDFGADERLMIDTAEQFSRKEVLPNIERLQVQEDGLMPALIRQAGELGLLGVDAPVEHGGLGLGKNLAARILELLSLDASFSVTAGVTSGIGIAGLSWFGSEAQKAKYLPKVVSGEWIAAYCLSEPDSGSDALSISTKAVHEGGRWILNGTKMWVSNAKWADLFVVMAKVGGEHLSAFLVERGFPGVSVGREENKMGLKGSSTARLVLENAEVPDEGLLFEVGQGHRVALNALNLGRFKLAAMSLGPGRQSLSEAIDYAHDRKQFGAPIASFGLIQRKFVEMAALYFTAEAMVYRTGALIDGAFARWGGTPEGNRKAAEEYVVECSASKVFATEVESLMVDESLQVYGGYGFTEDFPAARHYRDARVSRIYEGTNEINRIAITSRLKKLAELGRCSLSPTGDSFISDLAGKALRLPCESQVQLGAVSDLIMLAFAEQSARVRANRLGGIGKALYEVALARLNVQAGASYQIATGDSVALPSAAKPEWADIAQTIYATGGPLRFPVT